ncbi:NADH dehydrogenase subunit M [Peptoclostridium litorale DSM 5388]|uniref:Putative antiporter subunit MnhA2 n=1 Tax=Peptoclostridium litorale DSM 5388 TaxID=1121324 RepID=A0A069RBX3_PEPLI|nr:complex I subunit 5 family protein [Peptoclostridium litorale]KDR93745.1 putative antiporter subunit MnhA2 [Peptoclostridium litorale DSM 5388]SIN85012.1 NADH dehydrogenase subunit M [Peptoclostridium litorale DSM 5388]
MNIFLMMFILFFPAAMAPAVYWIGKRSCGLMDAAVIGSLAAETAAAAYMLCVVRYSQIVFHAPGIMTTGFEMKMDSFRAVFVLLGASMWLLCGIYCMWHMKGQSGNQRFYAFYMMALSATTGVFMSENVVNMFAFFEIMAITSYVLVVHSQGKSAHESGKFYLAVSIVTALVTLLGIVVFYTHSGSLSITDIEKSTGTMGNAKYAAAFLMSFGFLAKACIFPLHIWLPSTYSHSQMPVTIILSTVLSKAGIFGIMTVGFILGWDRHFSHVVMALALTSMLLGGVLALLKTDVKEKLAYGSMSQMGYITLVVSTVGLSDSHGGEAIMAAVYHCVNHALFKGAIFMAFGIICAKAKSSNVNDLKLTGKGNIFITATFMFAAASNMGIAGSSGFVSKTMIHHSLSYYEGGIKYMGTFLETIFLISSGITAAYLIKLFRAVFRQDFESEHSGEHEPSKSNDLKFAYFPMALICMFMIAVAVRPHAILNIAGSSVMGMDIHPGKIYFYSIKSAAYSLVVFIVGILIYSISKLKTAHFKNGVRIYVDPSQEWMHIKNDIYMPLCRNIFYISDKVFGGIDSVEMSTIGFAEKCIVKISQRGKFCEKASNTKK